MDLHYSESEIDVDDLLKMKAFLLLKGLSCSEKGLPFREGLL